jgi:hypothetical protein
MGICLLQVQLSFCTHIPFIYWFVVEWETDLVIDKILCEIDLIINTS